MTVVLWIAAVMLTVAGFLALVRIARGPSSLDRVVALDVVLSCMIAAIGLEAAYHRHGLTLSVLAVLALLGFVGSVTVARFGAGIDPDENPPRAGESTAPAPALNVPPVAGSPDGPPADGEARP